MSDNQEKFLSNDTSLITSLNNIIDLDTRIPGHLETCLRRVLHTSNIEEMTVLVEVLCSNPQINEERIENLFRQNILSRSILQEIFSSMSPEHEHTFFATSDTASFSKYLTLKDLARGIIPGEIIVDSENDDYSEKPPLPVIESTSLSPP